MTDVTTQTKHLTARSIVSREGRDGSEQDHIEVPISSTRADRDGDEFAEDALHGMADQIKSDQPLIFLNHGFTSFEKPLYDARDTIGTLADANVKQAKDADDKELIGLINPDETHPEGERMLQQVRDGQAVKFSVGFRVLEAEEKNPDVDGDDSQQFKAVDLMETSKVGIPSNPDATASVAAKAAHVTEALGAAGVEIDDEAAFAKALAGELLGDDPEEAETDLRRRDVLEGLDGTPTVTKPKCDSDADCPEGEVCVDGECVDEDSVTDDTDNFIMDDEAEERFASLEETINQRFASLETTIEEVLAADAEAEPDDDEKDAEPDDELTDEERAQLEALLDKADDVDAAESETTDAPDEDDVVDPDQTDDADADEDDHQYPEDMIA